MDAFAGCLFANVLTANSFIPVFKREYKSGLYSPHMFYFGNWLIKFIFLGFYPMILYGFVFHVLELKDSSDQNFLQFMKIAWLQSFNGVALGHMWSTVFDQEIDLITSAFAVKVFCTSGAGLFNNGTTKNIL